MQVAIFVPFLSELHADVNHRDDISPQTGGINQLNSLRVLFRMSSLLSVAQYRNHALRVGLSRLLRLLPLHPCLVQAPRQPGRGEQKRSGL